MNQEQYRKLIEEAEIEVVDAFLKLINTLQTDVLKRVDVEICEVLNRREEGWYE